MKLRVATPAPVLSTSGFFDVFGGKNKDRVLLDDMGLNRAMELVALPGQLVDIISIEKDNCGHEIAQVKISGYSSKWPLYIDVRFLDENTTDRSQPFKWPTIEEIKEFFISLLGMRYIWGGNYSKGIKEMISFYPPDDFHSLSDLQRKNWLLEGVDCSGMLYEVCKGRVPRNTIWLETFGKSLSIENRSAKEIAKNVKPLDMIIFSGHVIYVLDEKTTIESRACRGEVFSTPLLERLEQIFAIEKKQPMSSSLRNNYKAKGFIINRWYPTGNKII